MLRKTIKYTDYDGNEREEDFYFNLSKAEVLERELTTAGGLTRALQKIIAEKDNKRIIEAFKDIILKSYGEKSADGRKFVKSPELAAGFSQTEAYSELFMELSTNAEAAAEFVNAIIPRKVRKESGGEASAPGNDTQTGIL